MKIPSNPWIRMGLLVCGAGLIGVLLLVSGAMPVAASSGHFAITKAFLKFAMQRSVATHSMGINGPSLEDERLVTLGAGHYESGCRYCHGAPGIAPPAVARASTPAPPPLDHAGTTYDSAELFYIVRHGVKFTGMPAWPSAVRDDEVWAVVAFLEAWPSFDRKKYEALVYGSSRGYQPEGAPRAISECARCHGLRGQGRGDAFPQLAAQSAEYLDASLRAYAEGKRPSGIMQQVAQLSERERKELSEWFANQPSPQPRGRSRGNESIFLKGQQIAEQGILERNIPSCEDCHGPDTATRRAYPVLAGQPDSYLQQQLKLFAAGHRGGSPFARLMTEVKAHALEPGEMAAVSAYYSSLAPKPKPESQRKPDEHSRTYSN